MNLPLYHNYSLQAFNTLAVPCEASHYTSVTNLEQMQAALEFADHSRLELLVLGGGSNMILPQAFPGLVLHMAIKGFERVDEDSESVWLRVGAGEVWHDLVDYSLERNFFGLENLSLIPGTVGAAPIQNIGAYGAELDSVFHSLEAVERGTGKVANFSREDCAFRYRDSAFKNGLKDRYIITRVTFKLSKKAAFNLDYRPLQEAMANIPAEQLSARIVSEAVCKIRRSKLPDPAEIPNAGSFFKNPIVDERTFAALHDQYPDIASYAMDGGQVKIAAAWLLDKAGWRGHSEEGLGMHVNQALVLVNPGRRPGEAILAYAARLQQDIEQRFGIRLEREPVAY